MTQETLLQKRLEELAERAYAHNSFTFTDFLGLHEQNVLHVAERTLSCAGLTLYGGMEDCERLMARFGDAKSAGYEQPFPIACIQAEPQMQKYADALTHRDILGALMHLGIERSCIGDILIYDNIAYFFCVERMADTIIQELSRARHTSLQCTRISAPPANLQKQRIPEMLQVASIRADAVVCAVFSLSRRDGQSLFAAKKVFINGRCTENPAVTLKEHVIVSVRGMGRFRYLETTGTTRKGNLRILVEKYQ